MKILICSTNFAPEQTGIGKYSGEMAAWLVERGHEVRAICAPPYYPNWRVASEYRRPLYKREEWRGVDVWRAPIWVPRRPTGLTRVLHLLTFAFSSFPLMLRQIFWGPDLVLCVAPALVCAPAALLTARLSGAEAWLHVQDFEVDVAFRLSLLKGNLLQRVVLRMEALLLRRFDVVSTISGRMVERLLKKGVRQDRIRYFPNWVDVSQIKPTVGARSYRRRLEIDSGSVIAMFSGSLGGKQGLMVIPEAARLLADREDIAFVICGDGMMKRELVEASAGLSNIYFLPLQPFERLGDLLSTADIHLLPQSLGASDLVLPSKLSGMLASGRPVIATCAAGTELDAVVSQCGIVVPPQDGAALAAAVVQLAGDRSGRMELGRRARAYAEANFARETVFGRVFGPYESEGAVVPDDAIA
jgi:colanic acid biosynthesis glycosyl transferase WcaI